MTHDEFITEVNGYQVLRDIKEARNIIASQLISSRKVFGDLNLNSNALRISCIRKSGYHGFVLPPQKANFENLLKRGLTLLEESHKPYLDIDSVLSRARAFALLDAAMILRNK